MVEFVQLNTSQVNKEKLNTKAYYFKKDYL